MAFRRRDRDKFHHVKVCRARREAEREHVLSGCQFQRFLQQERTVFVRGREALPVGADPIDYDA
jgi:hypothetical protein